MLRSMCRKLRCWVMPANGFLSADATSSMLMVSQSVRKPDST